MPKAIRAGVDSIEHASLIDDEGIRLAKKNGTYLVMDIYNDTFILEYGASVGMLPESTRTVIMASSFLTWSNMA